MAKEKQDLTTQVFLSDEKSKAIAGNMLETIEILREMIKECLVVAKKEVDKLERTSFPNREKKKERVLKTIRYTLKSCEKRYEENFPTRTSPEIIATCLFSAETVARAYSAGRLASMINLKGPQMLDACEEEVN